MSSVYLYIHTYTGKAVTTKTSRPRKSIIVPGGCGSYSPRPAPSVQNGPTPQILKYHFILRALHDSRWCRSSPATPANFGCVGSSQNRFVIRQCKSRATQATASLTLTPAPSRCTSICYSSHTAKEVVFLFLSYYLLYRSNVVSG